MSKKKSPKKKSVTKKTKIKVKYSRTPKSIFNELKERTGSLKKLAEEVGISYYYSRKLNNIFNKPKPSLFKAGSKPKKRSKVSTYKKEEAIERLKYTARKRRVRMMEEVSVIKGKVSGYEKITTEDIIINDKTRLVHARFSVLYVGKKGEKYERYISQTFYPPYNKKSKEQIKNDCVEYLKAQSGQPYIAYLILLDFSVVTYSYDN